MTTKADNKPAGGSKKTETSASKTDLATYLKGVRTEWGKITWPSRMQVISQTIVVLFMVTIMTLGIWLSDRLLHDGLVCHIIPNGAERCAAK